jgi:hypothetical protein
MEDYRSLALLVLALLVSLGVLAVAVQQTAEKGKKKQV